MSTEKKSALRIEIDALLSKLAVDATRDRETTVECNIWRTTSGEWCGTACYLRERPGTWVRFTAQNIKSSAGVETLLRDALKTMAEAGK